MTNILLAWFIVLMNILRGMQGRKRHLGPHCGTKFVISLTKTCNCDERSTYRSNKYSICHSSWIHPNILLDLYCILIDAPHARDARYALHSAISWPTLELNFWFAWQKFVFGTFFNSILPFVWFIVLLIPLLGSMECVHYDAQRHLWTQFRTNF